MILYDSSCRMACICFSAHCSYSREDVFLGPTDLILSIKFAPHNQHELRGIFVIWFSALANNSGDPVRLENKLRFSTLTQTRKEYIF